MQVHSPSAIQHVPSELDRLGDDIAELSAHLDAATALGAVPLALEQLRGDAHDLSLRHLPEKHVDLRCPVYGRHGRVIRHLRV